MLMTPSRSTSAEALWEPVLRAYAALLDEHRVLLLTVGVEGVVDESVMLVPAFEPPTGMPPLPAVFAGWVAALERLCGCEQAAEFKRQHLYTAVEGAAGQRHGALPSRLHGSACSRWGRCMGADSCMAASCAWRRRLRSAAIPVSPSDAGPLDMWLFLRGLNEAAFGFKSWVAGSRGSSAGAKRAAGAADSAPGGAKRPAVGDTQEGTR